MGNVFKMEWERKMGNLFKLHEEKNGWIKSIKIPSSEKEIIRYRRLQRYSVNSIFLI